MSSGHMKGNIIRADATLIFNHEALLQVHQGQMFFSTMFMFDIFVTSNKLNINSQFFFYPFTIYNEYVFLSVFIKLHKYYENVIHKYPHFIHQYPLLKGKCAILDLELKFS